MDAVKKFAYSVRSSSEGLFPQVSWGWRVASILTLLLLIAALWASEQKIVAGEYVHTWQPLLIVLEVVWLGSTFLYRLSAVILGVCVFPLAVIEFVALLVSIVAMGFLTETITPPQWPLYAKIIMFSCLASILVDFAMIVSEDGV